MGIKRKLIFGCAAIAFLVQWPLVASAAVTNQSIMVPAYNYPERGGTNAYWSRLLQAGGNNVPILVANVNSGPDVVPKADYQTTLAKAKAAGSKIIGYVRTGYETKSIDDTLAEIDRWYAFYGRDKIDGIFFDEISNRHISNQDKVCYLATVYNYVKATYGGLTFANPGSEISDDMAPYADVFVTAEYNYAKYKHDYKVPMSEFERNPANQNRMMHMVYEVGAGDVASVIRLSRERNAGYIFITDDNAANPYDALPSYFSSLRDHVKALPPVSISHEPTRRYPTHCVEVAASSQQRNSQPGETTADLTITNARTAKQRTTVPVTVKFNVPAGASVTKVGGAHWKCQGDHCTYAPTIARGAAAERLSVSLRSVAGGAVGYTVTAADQPFAHGTVAVAKQPDPRQQPSSPPASSAPAPSTGSSSSSAAQKPLPRELSPALWLGALTGGGVLLVLGVLVARRLRNSH